MGQQVAVTDGATGGAYAAVLYSENSCMLADHPRDILVVGA